MSNFADVSPTTRSKILFAWAISMIISISIYLGAVNSQLTFATGKICLLYVENYHFSEQYEAWIFDSFSPSCGASVAAGSIGLVLLFGLVGIKIYYLKKNEEPNRRVILAIASIASVWAFITFVMACVYSAGIGKTCSEFEKSSKSCGAVFGDGFFSVDTSNIHRKNINTINAGLGASWVVFIGFTGYALYEWNEYRQSSLKWW